MSEKICPELDYNPISTTFAKQFIQPFKTYFHPTFLGMDELNTEKPAMYVTNHSVLGVFDLYPFAIELYLKKGIILRALVDSNHYKIPVWRDIITDKLGVVEASRENCGKIMLRNENLAVFPGGTREICKKKGEAYELKWEDRTGFVQMAMQYGYDIIPVAAVGAEEAYEIVMDANDILNHTTIGKLLKFSGLAKSVFKNGDLIPPVVKGVGNSIIPKRQKLYYSFGKRISTVKYKKKYEDIDTQNMIKNKVELSLLKEFEKLFILRDKNK